MKCTEPICNFDLLYNYFMSITSILTNISLFIHKIPSFNLNREKAKWISNAMQIRCKTKHISHL